MNRSAASIATLTYTLALAGICSIHSRATVAQAQASDQPALTTQHVSREAQLAALRLKAQNRMAQDLTWYSATELREIEAEYVSIRSPRRQTLEALAARYPRSNRAGCAIAELARMSAGDVRERYLKIAIDEHSDAWFENGTQVGPLAMALLAVHYAGLDRLAEAERLAAEMSARYPGAVDSTGASLDELLPALKLLRPRK
jgi:transketolase